MLIVAEARLALSQFWAWSRLCFNTRELDEQRYLYQRTFAKVEIVECAIVVGEASHRALYVPTIPQSNTGTVLWKQRMLLVKWNRT